MSITELSIKRPSLVIVVFLVLGMLGLFSLSKLSMELIPKFTAPFVIITTMYPGASPAEVENSVTKVVEDAVSNMENIVSLRSTSFEGMSFTFIEMKDGTNVDIAIADAQRKVNAIEAQLPDNAEPPALTKFASDEFPILSIGATANATPTEFYDLVVDRIKPAISSVKGVGEVRIIGGQEREIQVNVNRQALEARGMTIQQVVQAVQSANLDFPTGKIENPSEQITVRLAGKFQTVDDLRSLVVTNRNGAPVKLEEIAEVVDSQKDLVNLSRVDGKEAIGLQILKTSDANAVAVADGVIAKLDELKRQYNHADSAKITAVGSPSGVGGDAAALNLDFAIANNQTDFTREAVDAVWHDLLLAIVLVAVVMLFFLHSIRNALIVMLAIPTSLITTGILMYAAGFTLNLMTLLAMSLVIGILVDDSIVVLENIYRHLEQGMKRKRAALLGRNEIAFTALSITLVDVVVFLPISLMTGIVGNIMRSFALVVVFSTMVSLLVSFTLTPMLASRFSKVERFNNRTIFGLIFNGFEQILHRVTNWYGRVISRILNPIRIPYSAARVRRLEEKEMIDGRPRKKHFNFYLTGVGVLAATFIAFFASFGLIGNGYIGTAFIQPSDRGEFILKLELPKDATLKETNQAALKAEEFLSKKGEITGTFSTVGAASGMFAGQSSSYIAELTMKLVPQDERGGVHTDLYAQQVRNELERQLPGVKVTSAPVSFFGGADEDPLQIFVAGADKEAVMKYANQALDSIRKVPGTLEPKLSIEEGSPEVRVTVDRDRMAKLGLDLATVGMTMQTAYNGNDDVQFRSGDKEYDITIKMDDFNRSRISDIANLALMNNQGQLIRLSQFASVTQTTGPNQLERNDRQPSVTIKSKVLGRPSGAVGADVKRIVEETMPPPPGLRIAYEGDLKNQAEAGGSMGLALLAALLGIYFVLVALYDSWIYPFVVGVSILPAFIGAFLAMALTLSVLDIFSALGIIMMMGLVTKNAILLVDFANQAKAEGMSTHDALVEAGRTRLRPILMTTLAMAVGMLPIALAKGAGAEWKNGLAWALIGGLLGSMLLTLVVAPVVYQMVDGLKKMLGIKEKKKDDDEWGEETPSANGKPVSVEPVHV